jgi:hypothetical protein
MASSRMIAMCWTLPTSESKPDILLQPRSFACRTLIPEFDGRFIAQGWISKGVSLSFPVLYWLHCMRGRATGRVEVWLRI